MDYEGVSSCNINEIDYASGILLLLLLVGVLSNVSVASLLRAHWQRLSNLKIVMSVCVCANTLTLLFKMHEPMNSIFQGCNSAYPGSPRRWVFGAFMCSVLPSAFMFSLAASVISWSALARCYYHTKVYNYHLTKSETETITFLVWAIAATLTAPFFCMQVLVYDGEYRAELCLTVWASSRQAKLNSAWLIVLQYAIPFATIISCISKTLLHPNDHKQTRRWYPFVCSCISMLSIAGVLLVVCLIPFRVDGFDPRFQRSMSVIDPHKALSLLRSFTLYLCLAVPFILWTLITREQRKPDLYVGRSSDEEDIYNWKSLWTKMAVNQNEIV